MRYTKWDAVPKCKKGKYHRWKDSFEKYGETMIYIRCRCDICESRYRSYKGS